MFETGSLTYAGKFTVILIFRDQYFCSSYPRNRHKRGRLIKGKNALCQRQLCKDQQ